MNIDSQLSVWLVGLAAGLAAALMGWLLLDLSHSALRVYRQRLHREADTATRELFLQMTPSMLFKWTLVLIIACGAVVWGVTGSPMAAAAMMAMTAFAPRGIVRLLKRRRLARIEEQLPPMLQAIGGNMKAGIALTESLEQVAAESLPPLSQEIGKVLHERHLGKSLDEALENLSLRLPLPSIVLATSAIRIAANVGGPLADTLERLAATLRSKRAVEGKIRALTSQGRLQVWIMGLLPIVLMLVLLKLEPEDMGQLFTTGAGYATLAAIAVLEVLGVLLARKICAIDA